MATKPKNIARLKANRRRRVAAGGPRRKPRAGGARRSRRKAKTTHLRTEFYSQSLYSVRKPKSKQVALMQAVSAPNTQVFSEQLSIQAVSGTQNYKSVSILSNNDIKNLYAQLPQAGTASSSGYGVRRLVVDSIMTEHLISNVTTVPVEFTIYDITLKKDLPSTWLYLGTSFNYTFLPDPATYWQEGVNIASNQSPGQTLAATAPGATPYDSQFFKDYFKVERRTVVLLRQGGSHRHIVNFSPNTLVKEDEVGAGIGLVPNFGLRRLSRFVMIVAKGFPCADFTVPLSPPLATISSAALMIVQTSRVKFQFVLDCTSTYNFTNGLSNPLLGSQSVINVGSGAYGTPQGAFYP